MSTEAPALRLHFHNHSFTVGSRDGRIAIACECDARTWDSVDWPTDEQLSAAVGLRLSFFEAGGQYEGLYAFEAES